MADGEYAPSSGFLQPNPNFLAPDGILRCIWEKLIEVLVKAY